MVVFLFIQLSRLPLSVLYRISDLLSFILDKVFKYRKQVIQDNLKNSFPDLAENERNRLVQEFYRYLADIIVETIKFYRMTDYQIMDRMKFENPEVLKKHESKEKNVIIMMGHSGNWEWAGAATALNFDFLCMPVYRKLKDNSVDEYFKYMRSRQGAIPVLDKEISKIIPQQTKKLAVAMLADQTPGGRKGWWLTFLNQVTPFFRGTEILATRNPEIAVVFAHVKRKSRGRYSILLEDAPMDWRKTPYALTIAFTKFLEKQIEKDRANWLWSHKRWKHKPRDNSMFID